MGDARRPLSLSAIAAARPRKDAASVAPAAPKLEAEEATKPRRRRANAKATEEDVGTVSEHHDKPNKTETKTKRAAPAKAPLSTEEAAADPKTTTADKKLKASKKTKAKAKVVDELSGEEVAGSGTPMKNARKGGEKAPTTTTGEMEKTKKATRKTSSTLNNDFDYVYHSNNAVDSMDAMAAAAAAAADADAGADTDAEAAQHRMKRITHSVRELTRSPGEIGHINDGGNKAAGASENLDDEELGDELQLEDELKLNDRQIAAVELAIGIPERKIKAALRLRLVEGNTVPFIARYRQEMTGGLDEEEIRKVEKEYEYQRRLELRKEATISAIAKQGKLTDELAETIRSCTKLQRVEDLYAPYKEKRNHSHLGLGLVARGTNAQEDAGVGGDCQRLVLERRITDAELDAHVAQHVDEEKGLPRPEDVIEGVKHIIAEMVKGGARDLFERIAYINATRAAESDSSKSTASDGSVYAHYENFSKLARYAKAHQILALNRGEKQKFLKFDIVADHQALLDLIRKDYRLVHHQPAAASDDGKKLSVAAAAGGQVVEVIEQAIADSLNRLLLPSLKRELRAKLTEQAEQQAISIFARNVENILIAPPVRGKTILGIDPGFRSGCKLAVIDEGQLVEVDTIYPHKNARSYSEAMTRLAELVVAHGVNLVAIGNGTGHREAEELVSETIKRHLPDHEALQFAIVSESGASAYSASPEAAQEFPELEAQQRGTVSIARRLQDPLSEIIKVPVENIGVGLYQHDVDRKGLVQAIGESIEKVVNRVGVNLNTASLSLLQYVSGLDAGRARKILAYRQQKPGPIANRAELRNVSGIGAKTFEQAAGFLRVYHRGEGKEPLDATSIHPESYGKTYKLLVTRALRDVESDPVWRRSVQQQLDVGEATLEDILTNLKKPGLDIRDDLPPPLFRREVATIGDLKVGDELMGTVTNVVPFGAFCDIGVDTTGLCHVRHLSPDPTNDRRKEVDVSDLVAVGDVLKLKIISIDLERKRIGLQNLSSATSDPVLPV
ncbi:Texlike RNA-binding protein, putative [Acanthamoeba castellanii str. Neff]|uniref:Texlike RNA-binding protein, putative n=1 Tax=Acanthamoeba castellanii (strain ATCC 30010 / Neff) TaxID=1257118 RepID=L8GVZ9_ACACF|nr:Texlike RNA-binding protein, putative [Acanthamoeba castellanii str. Neff]ELR17404.1 Texlike RNA-binding protein, putative [Acanthamoeba castellanii str. Neff]